MSRREGVGDELVRELYIDAPPGKVFEYLTVAEKVASWWGASEIDPVPGGVYRVKFLEGRVTVRGEVVDVVPGERFVHTWGWEGDWSPIGPGESTVEITLSPKGDGTLLRLRHYDLDGTADFHTLGWAYYLPRLASAAGGEDPGKDLGPPELREFATTPPA